MEIRVRGEVAELMKLVPAIDEIVADFEFLVSREEIEEMTVAATLTDEPAELESDDLLPGDIRAFVVKLTEAKDRGWRLAFARRCHEAGLGLKKAKTAVGIGRDLWVHTLPDKGQRAVAGLRPSSGRLEVRIEYEDVHHRFPLAEPVSNSVWTRIYLVDDEHVDQAVELTMVAAKREKEPFVCATCGESFSVPVWECLACGHHSHDDETECGDCHVDGLRSK